VIYLVLKVISGEEVIGMLDVDDVAAAEDLQYFDLIDPMWIVADQEGSMKLRSATILAFENKLIVLPEGVIASYIPSQSLIDYYKMASGYTQKYTQIEIDKQIRHATEDLVQAAKEADEFESNLTRFIAKTSKVSIH
jgi:hypothetical protein